jgi:hypothetical protein
MSEFDGAKARFMQHFFLLSEPFVAKFLFQLLTKDEYSSYQRVFFNHLFGTNNDLNTRKLGFVMSHGVEHRGLGMVSLIGKKGDEVIFIEPRFYSPLTDETCISRLVKILDTCYKDRASTTIYVLTLKNRLDYYKGSLLAKDGKLSCDTEKVRIRFLFWEEILGSFRNLSQHRQQASVSSSGGIGMQNTCPQEEGKRGIQVLQNDNFSTESDYGFCCRIIGEPGDLPAKTRK